MPVVRPLSDCIARPNSEDGQKFPLKTHLVAVAFACGSPDGTLEERISFLAGLLHDAAKTHFDWQDYIRDESRKEGPPHAPFGAALFAYCAEQLIATWPDRQSRRVLEDAVVHWARAIYDHHSELHDLHEEFPPWDETGARRHFYEDVEACDPEGIFVLVKSFSFFPEVQLSRQGFLEWLETFPDRWTRRVRIARGQLLDLARKLGPSEEIVTARQALLIPRTATRLVAGDRYHAGSFEQVYLSPDEAGEGCRRLLEFCQDKARQDLKDGADPELVRRRQEVQQKAVDTYRDDPQNPFYTLLLPTGYGKTLSALRVALTACEMGRCKRVIYVAPYLSILSQNTGDISASSGIEAIQHHHLSLAELDDKRLDQIEALETWQAPILTTTFNQLFRAIFPRRAHQCLRIEALKEAFIIVDEPQIIDIVFWNVFLRILGAMADDLSFQLLFTTATLPPLESGLTHPVVNLVSEAEPAGRFEVLIRPEESYAQEVADLAIQKVRETGSVAVVMNTVRDAAQIFKLVQPFKKKENIEVYCLTALMLPTHKSETISKIHKALKEKRSVIAVCTQILEAGVNLSFRTVLRAVSTFPSIVQVSGRANRHGEGDRARVVVFRFVRDDGEDSRRWVYRDKTALAQTDRLLNSKGIWPEEELIQAMREYYGRCWDENPNAATLEYVEKATRGKWSELAGIEPFSGGPPRESLFVNQPKEKLNCAMRRLQDRFAPEGGQQLLQKYLDWRFRAKLEFVDRKRISALLRQYLVPVPKAIASRVGEQMNDFLWRLIESKDYSPDTGFAHLLSEEEKTCRIE